MKDTLNNLLKILKSKKFKKAFKRNIEKDTWDKGLPKVYMENGKIIKHYKDGTKEIVERNILSEGDLDVKSNGNRKNSTFILK